REPPLLLLAAFLWGAVIAIPPALYIERALTAALGASSVVTLGNALTQALTAGVTEELIKGAGLLILLLLLRDEFDNVTDGVIYGFLIVGRVLLGWLGHSTFTAAFGAGLGYAREAHGARGRRYRILAPLIGLLAALLLQ